MALIGYFDRLRMPTVIAKVLPVNREQGGWLVIADAHAILRTERAVKSRDAGERPGVKECPIGFN
jgi:hypothetical protein